MLYFKHTELAQKYYVSLRTVHNWIDAAKNGKLDLELYHEGSKSYVANTERNMVILTELTESRRKYRNTKASKTVTPLPEFYSIYNERQVYDIATNLEIHREIPRQYNYFNGGADYWDKYDESRVNGEETGLLESNRGYLDELLEKYKRVNVIDVGVGNAYPAKDFIAHLVEQGKMGRYIALDISPRMLEIAENNVKEWFGGKVAIETHECDINYERFSQFLIDDYAKEDAKDVVNVVLLLGGTLSNMRTPDGGFKTIHDSMGINDILIHTTKLDNEVTRHYFDFHLSERELPPVHKIVVDLLNIDSSYYQVEVGYDPTSRLRFERIRLKVSLSIRFKFNKGERSIKLNKGDSILTWRFLQQSQADVYKQFSENDFYVLQSSQTNDFKYIMTIAKVKHD